MPSKRERWMRILGALLVGYLAATTIMALSGLHLGRFGLAQADASSLGIILGILALPIVGIWLIATEHFARTSLILGGVCLAALLPMMLA